MNDWDGNGLLILSQRQLRWWIFGALMRILAVGQNYIWGNSITSLIFILWLRNYLCFLKLKLHKTYLFALTFRKLLKPKFIFNWDVFYLLPLYEYLDIYMLFSCFLQRVVFYILRTVYGRLWNHTCKASLDLVWCHINWK